MLRSVKYGLNGAVLAGLIATPVLWSSVDKTVRLVVDGHATTVHTTASRVGEVLDGAGYRVSGHDLVAPSSGSAVHNGMQVVMRRGRLLHLDVDGVHKDVWTTAPTVQAALAQLGYTTQDFVSVSRSQRLPLSATDIAIRTPRHVTVVHDGGRQRVITTDSTVGQLLNDLQVTVGKADWLSAGTDASLHDGEVITIQRVTHALRTKSVAIKYATSHRASSALTRGTTRVAAAGHMGLARVTYALLYVDGRVVAVTKVRTLEVRKPTARVIYVGTKQPVAAKPTPASTSQASHPSSTQRVPSPRYVPSSPAPTPGSAQAIAKSLLPSYGWGSSDQYYCLVQMWNRESGWNVHAANPSGAYGIPQALPGSKMGSAGPDWQNNATTQIKWGLGYIGSRYGSPCGAWSYWQAHGWY